jgi:hypothetical protein
MRFPIRRLLAVAGALVVPAIAQAQATISGQVTAENGQPVVGASVFLEGLQIGAQTTDAGRYNILVPAARATGQTASLSVRAIGASRSRLHSIGHPRRRCDIEMTSHSDPLRNSPNVHGYSSLSRTTEGK